MSTLTKYEKAYEKIVNTVDNYIICRCTLKDGNIYSEESIETNKSYIDKIDKLLTKYNYSINMINLFNTPILILAIYNLMHPIFIEYLKDKMNNNDIIVLPKSTIYNKKFHVFNKNNIQNTVSDLLTNMYIMIHYDILDTTHSRHISKDQQFALLDKYARIFNVTYEKITYD